MSNSSKSLTTLEQLEEMFKDRYSSDDSNYQDYLNCAHSKPPVVPNWQPKYSSRDDRNSRNQYGDNRRYRYRNNSHHREDYRHDDVRK